VILLNLPKEVGLKRFADESADCDQCGRTDDLKTRDGLTVCYDCQEELDRAA
jgi:hypothetical protein